MKTRCFYSSMAAMTVGVAMLSAPAYAAEITLKLGTVANPKVSMGQAIVEVLMPKVKEYSNGRMEVVPHWSGSICGEQKCGEQAMQGLVDIATSSTANFGNFSATYAITDLPFIFKDGPNATKLALGWFGKELHARALKETPFRVFGVFSVGGFRALGNSVRPVKEPKDLKGIKIRVTKSPVEFTLIKAWGGVPIPYDWTQLYQGLQTGVVNGQYVQQPWQDLAKLHEVTKHYTIMGGAWGANVVYMHEKRFQKLPKWGQEALQKAMDEFVPAAIALDDAWTAKGAANIKNNVKTYYKPNAAEQAKWNEGAVQAWKGAKGTYDAKMAERALKEQGLSDLLAKLKAAKAL